ncbi:Colicin V production protein [Anaerohalosphaera lusitana]|uniref:Colicin V production protein n=1 Tax=Anaerohalosphaera lusitana TaxID=1936003 RepID=A0A1U9NNN6_9BACT|nr:CvpA family protein [Anaerohalosphaera lusitana]AQT69338.1 Colicin V production protein [Anaerohalosphaera lusitana]
MFAYIAIPLITILCVAQFYLKNSLLKSVATLLSALIALITAFGFYEPLAETLISRGYGVEWAQPGCFILLFAITFAVARILSDFMIGANIEFGRVPRVVSAIVCGALVGIIVSGTLIVALAMTPLHPKIPYDRFGESLNVSQPKSTLLNADVVVTKLFNVTSGGSFSAKRSFGVYHADFVDQLHLSRRKTGEDVMTIAARDAITIEKDGVKRIDSGTGPARTHIRVGIKGSSVKDGGARQENQYVAFTPAQMRLVCVSKTDPSDASILYPKAYKPAKQNWPASRDEKIDLDEVIKFAPNDFKSQQKIAWIDLAYQVPSNCRPLAVEFKKNTIEKVPSASEGDDEPMPADTSGEDAAEE